MLTLLLCCLLHPPFNQAFPDSPQKEGVRRALLVGVSRYRDVKAHLTGPTYDVADMERLLKNRFDFTDVRELLNEDATPDAFRSAMATLTEDSGPRDWVVVYFSGHGGQIDDSEGEEGDGKDETLVFYEPGEGEHGHIVDDEFNQMLRKLYGKTTNLVIILDSCHAGTGYRVPNNGATRLWRDDPESDRVFLTRGDGNPYESGLLPEAVRLCASRDGSPARDLRRNGAFTKALIGVLSAPDARGLTWQKVEYRLKIRLRGYAPSQIPSFAGPLWRPVFGGSTVEPPLFWKTGEPQGEFVNLTGPPMTGMGPGATMLVHNHQTPASAFGDPKRAAATIVIRDYSGVSAKAEIREGKVEGGDSAVLYTPVSILEPMGIRIRYAPKKGGLSDKQAQVLEGLIADPRCRGIGLDQQNGVFEFYLEEGQLVLGDEENPVYTSFPYDWPERGPTIVACLQQLAFRHELLALQPRGPLSKKEDLLTVGLEPNVDHSSCSRGDMIPALPGRIQNIPLCHAWNVRVSVHRNGPREGVRVGGLLLGADGGILGFPFENGRIILPGQSVLFKEDEETFIAGPPVGVLDTLIIFATEPDHDVPWGRFTSPPAMDSRSRGHFPMDSQRDALDLLAGSTMRKGGGSANWSRVVLTLRVQTHAVFPDGPDLTPEKRFLLEHFDMRPYLPIQLNFRRRLLDEADRLVTHNRNPDSRTWPRDPLPPPRLEELARDPGRAISYLFSLADHDWRVPEAEFLERLRKGEIPALKPISENEVQMGDLLVYGDPSGFRHVVLVVDSGEHLAVGAFPWAEEPRFGFQKVLSARDWALLGYPKARLVGVYRHEKLSDQVHDYRGAVALKRLEGICNPKRCAH